MTHVATVQHRELPGDFWDTGHVILMGVFACDNCKRYLVGWGRVNRDLLRDSGDAEAWFDSAGGSAYWVPQVGTGKQYEDVPEMIAQAASEAHECYSINAHRAAVLLARAVIEATAKAKGIMKGTLEAKIDAMAEHGHVRTGTRDEAHEIRHLGNDMAHGDFDDEVTADDAEAVLMLMGGVLAEVFQQPAVAAKLKARREANKASKK